MERKVTRTGKTLGLLLVAVLAAPMGLEGQDVEESLFEEAPPSLAELELDRSRMCVPALARLADLERDLEPAFGRADRIRALHQAVTLEDSTRVAPFDPSDPVEAAVQEWFVSDGELAARWLEEEDEAIDELRREGREEIRQRLQEALEEVSQGVDERLAAEGNLGEAAVLCEDAILVRSAVLEACGGLDAPVCEAARDPEPTPLFRFVDEPETLWDLEQLRPWSEPTRVVPTPEGGLGGARTTTLARRGNLAVLFTLGPLIQERASLSEEEVGSYLANLESMGFEFDHPDLVMAPALSLQMEFPGILAGETDYLLHFGDLSEPEEQVVLNVAAREDGIMEATIPAPEWVLVRLAIGEELSLTAVRFSETDDEVTEGEALYSIPLTSVRQAQAVGDLLAYWAEGDFSNDLAALIPPSEEESPR